MRRRIAARMLGSIPARTPNQTLATRPATGLTG
jgi:hypothetical protein